MYTKTKEEFELKALIEKEIEETVSTFQICHKCARKTNNEIILKSMYKDSFDMADRGYCSLCSEIYDVFNPEILMLKEKYKISADNWDWKFGLIRLKK
jgi:hypothetical protein